MDAKRCDFCGHVRSAGEKFARVRGQVESISTDRVDKVRLYEPFSFTLVLCYPCADLYFERDPEREEWF